MADAASVQPQETPVQPPVTPPEAAKPDAAPPAPPAEPKESAAKRFALATAAHKRNLEAQQAIKAERESLARERAEFEAQRQALKADPMAALRQSGYPLTPEAEGLLGKFLQTHPQTPEAQVAELKAQMIAYQQEQERARQEGVRAAEAQRNAERERVVQQFQGEIGEFVKANGEALELCSAYSDTAVGLIYKAIEDTYKETKKIPTIKEAAETVEKYLEGEVEKALKAKKIASRFQPKAEEKPAAPSTITNGMVATPSSGLPAKTESERIARALAALERAGKP